MSWWKNLFSKSQPKIPVPEVSQITIPKEIVEMIPGTEHLQGELTELQRTRDSKKVLQRLDELITTAEAGIDSLSFEIDKFIKTDSLLREQIKSLNQPDSWQERALLMKLERILIHRHNLQQRIEIYNQNIRVYMSLIARIQDIAAMRMDGIDEDKIQAIWLDFKEYAEHWKERIIASDSSHEEKINVVSLNLEERLKKLRQEVFDQKTTIVEPEQVRPPIQENKATTEKPPAMLE